jgi:pimeloyl-ACP methyl ester carboxylesterase
MHIETHGEGPRTLVVIPGWRLDSETEKPDWLPVLEQRSGWRAVFVDLPGHGKSRGDHHGIKNQLDMLERLLAELDERRLLSAPLALAGTSNGATMAVAMANRRPHLVRGLSLRVPMTEADDSRRAASGQAMWQAALDALPDTYRRAYADKMDKVWEVARVKRIDTDFLASIRDDPARYALPAELLSTAQISCPALLILARQDERVGWEKGLSAFGRLAHATVAILDQAGHALPVGHSQAALWRALTHEWLDRVEAGLATQP